MDRFGLYEPTTEHDACGVGFVAHIRGQGSREIVAQGLEVLSRLGHRAACGRDPETGDGAGILVQLPHKLFWREGRKLGFDVPRRRAYGIGQVFLPHDDVARRAIENVIAQVVAAEGQRLLGWRDVPVDDSHLGEVARSVMPCMRQVFIARRRLVPSAFECKLYVIRKLVEARVRELGLDPQGRFHIASLSSDTLIYKGLLLPDQLPAFYLDLQDPKMESAIALVHSRFSTNTSPTWDLAQPFRYIAHNGEINTLQGNRNWMRARTSQLQSHKFWGKLDRLSPIIVPGKSDSAQFDNMVELLTLGGRSLPHAMMMMIPEAWENDALMSDKRRAYYQYAGTRMEPWDGPAAIAFTDGRLVGATLDRNGLRPCRYVITDDDRVILASEVGVLDVPPSQVKKKGRLRPGRMFIVDTEEGMILDDADVKQEIVGRWPYRRWLERNQVPVSRFADVEGLAPLRGQELQDLQRACGYTDEDLRLVIAPMAGAGAEPTGSMGTDTPLAVLSRRAPSLFNYFHQLFAQVTNPPIDPIREALVMSLRSIVGGGGNTFDETPEDCHSLSLDSPILTNAQLAKVRSVQEGVFEPTTLSLLFPAHQGEWGLSQSVDRLCNDAVQAIDDGYNILTLSDRGIDERHAAIPILLAVSAVHQHLVREGIRMQTSLVAETAEAREVHHFALLVGYGAAAINPYGALDSARALAESGEVSGQPDEAVENYIHAVEKGLLKVMSKMGISTVQSYRGAQIFEAVGIDPELIAQHFTGTPSRIGGVGLDELGRELIERHQRAYGPGAAHEIRPLPAGGELQWRRDGEQHKWGPKSIALLQAATAANDRQQFDAFSALMDDAGEDPVTLRDLLDLVDGDPIPLDEVEPVSEIVKRFVTGAMSFGSISAEAHETLAIAMNRLGGKSNSGEGGEEPRRFVLDENGDDRSSAIKQIASARFGVTAEYLVNAVDLQIKVAQGAKPGEGGQLPGHKVDARIAKVRCATPGVTLISPPPHHDIYSIEDLKQLIFDLRCANDTARISVKLVSEVGVGTIAAGVAKAGADVVVIAGWSGGTGASPLSSIKRAGLPWELGLAETQQVLMQNGLRSRIRVQVDGGLKTGRDVVMAAMLGAEEFGFATAALVVQGCILLRKCHLNTCSVGIATQDPGLRELFAGTPEEVARYFVFVAEQTRELLSKLGFRSLDALIGRVDLLTTRPPIDHHKARRLDLSPLLARADVPADAPRHFVSAVGDPALVNHVDRALLPRVRTAIDDGQPISVESPITNRDRTAGTLISSEVARRHGARGLVDDTIRVRFSGSAGQSFGAFLSKGITLELEGDANDYVAKGLSGGRIIVYPPADSRLVTHENVIVGNVVLYGATGGAAYFAGQAGERFAVRNSGAHAVVEGVGDHGCEYMTGGVVVVLGRFGWNFAAGMSGGVAFVFDKERKLADRANRELVDLEPLIDQSDIWLLNGMIEDHVRYTKSAHARRILDNWELMIPHFIKVMPVEYRRVLEARKMSAPPKRKLAVAGGSHG